jgi:hypothetical protein
MPKGLPRRPAVHADRAMKMLSGADRGGPQRISSTMRARRRGVALRALAPLLVASTAMIFATGVWLRALGHHSDRVLMLHKVAFIVWSGVFGVHFVAYLPRAARSLRGAWATSPSRQPHTSGRGIAVLLVATSLCAGLVLALVLLGHIGAWHRDYGV